MLVVATNHHAEILLNSNVASSRFLVKSNATIKGITYHEKISTFYWITAEGVSRSNSGGESLIYKINDVSPSGLALDKSTGNIYFSAIQNEEATFDGKNQSVIRVIASNSLEADVNIVTTQSIITDIALDNQNSILFWSEHTKPSTGRIVRATMDGQSTMWLYSIDKIVYPSAIAVDPIMSRIYWADSILQSISSSDYNGLKQRQEVAITNGYPLSLTFFENRLTWSLRDQDVLYSHTISGSSTSQHKLQEKEVIHIVTVHSVLELELPNPCVFSPCNNGICVLKNSSSFTCHCPIGVTVVSSNPFKCSKVTSCPRYFFQCRPDLKCHSRKLVCGGDLICRKLSVKKLCERLRRNITQSMGISLKVPPNFVSPKPTTQKALRVLVNSNCSNQMLSSETDYDYFPQIEETLQAVLDGPVHVLSRLFTRKGHNIGKSINYGQFTYHTKRINVKFIFLDFATLLEWTRRPRTLTQSGKFSTGNGS